MPSPSLIIGLGGTGTLVCTYVKKDLMELQGGGWPPVGVRILSFDTDRKQPAIGGQGEIRQAGKSTGAVQLGTGEFVFIGGNIENLVREVAAGQHPHLKSWLLAEFYLKEAKLSPALYNLNDGAGQFRQFGRMAVFRDVATPATSTLYNSIKDAMERIQQDYPNPKNVQVFLVASLAGGTGAGMFVDVAYLVRKIAEEVKLEEVMKLRGYLVLPDAFTNTLPDQSWLRSMYARSFAAMRENSRFTVSFDYARGYPIHYHSEGGHSIWHGSLKTKLFDLIYYIDGQGERNRLGIVDLKFGVTPMIADAISAAIDKEAGDAFANYVANIEAERVNRQTAGLLSPQTSTFGSVGTYTIVLPIYSIMEAWTHDMGLEALEALIAPEPASSKLNHPEKLKANANRENVGVDGHVAARDFLKATKPIEYQYVENGETKKLEAEPTLLLPELGRIAEAWGRPGRGIKEDLASRKISDWKPHFVPNSEDNETKKLLLNIEAILNLRLFDREPGVGQIQTSDQMKQKNVDLLSEAERIAEDARIFKLRHLGEEDPKSGQRAGGQYRTMLERIQAYHTDRFNRCLNYKIQNTLNGRINVSAVEAKSGKLGFLYDFLDNLFDSLDHVKQTLEDVRTSRRDKNSTRIDALASVQAARQAMTNSAGKKGFGAGNKARADQIAYLETEMFLVDILEAEAVEESILAAVDDMLDYVRSAREQVDTWQQTLALAANGLYAKLVSGRKQVDSDRAADKDITCRLVINDPDYEKRRYTQYIRSGNALERILGALTWRMQTRPEGNREKLVGLQLLVNQNGKATSLTADPDDENLLTWLQLCRQPFVNALQEESVIGYLLDHKQYKDPNELAKAVYNFSGVALRINAGNPLKANFLRAFFQDAEEAGHRDYLRKLIQSLAQLSGISSLGGGDSLGASESAFGRFVNSEDRFKFTLVFTEELIGLSNIDAYSKSGLKEYMGGEGKVAKGDRRVLHIFPAEVHAVEYEGRLPELNQPIRLFSDDVVLQLEDLEQFRLFLMAYVYGLIRKIGVKTGASATAKQVWALQIPPEKETDEFGNPALPEEIYLTDPEKPTSMHDALMTFNFVGKDIGHGEGHVHEIKYEQVSRILIRSREEDAKKRLEAGKAGEGDALKKSVESLPDESLRRDYLLELARIDRIREAFNTLRQKELPALRDELGKAANPDAQKEYDVLSVFALMLGDELKNVHQNVEAAVSGVQTF